MQSAMSYKSSQENLYNEVTFQDSATGINLMLTFFGMRINCDSLIIWFINWSFRLLIYSVNIAHLVITILYSEYPERFAVILTCIKVTAAIMDITFLAKDISSIKKVSSDMYDKCFDEEKLNISRYSWYFFGLWLIGSLLSFADGLAFWIHFRSSVYLKRTGLVRLAQISDDIADYVSIVHIFLVAFYCSSVIIASVLMYAFIFVIIRELNKTLLEISKSPFNDESFGFQIRTDPNRFGLHEQKDLPLNYLKTFRIFRRTIQKLKNDTCEYLSLSPFFWLVHLFAETGLRLVRGIDLNDLTWSSLLFDYGDYLTLTGFVVGTIIFVDRVSKRDKEVQDNIIEGLNGLDTTINARLEKITLLLEIIQNPNIRPSVWGLFSFTKTLLIYFLATCLLFASLFSNFVYEFKTNPINSTHHLPNQMNYENE